MGEHKKPFNGYTNVVHTMKSSRLLIFLYIERSFLSLWCQHGVNTPLTYEGRDKSTHWPINSRKPNNSRIHQLINLLTSQFINSPTHTLINLSTQNTHTLKKHTNLQISSTYKLTYSQTYNLKTSPTQKLKPLSFILQRHSNFHSVLGEMLVKKYVNWYHLQPFSPLVLSIFRFKACILYHFAFLFCLPTRIFSPPTIHF